MRHKNTVFRDVAKLVPRAVFERRVERHGSDGLVREPTTRQQLIARIRGQRAGAVSRRDICATLESHQTRLYHAGGKVPQSSTLADANANRGHEVFSGLFAPMLCMALRRISTPDRRRRAADR